MSEPGLQALLAGLVWGLPTSLLFFSGLAWGLRRALGSARPGRVLLTSFGLRASLLLLAVGWVSRWPHPLWSLAGFMLAFLLVRSLAVGRARREEKLLEAGRRESSGIDP